MLGTLVKCGGVHHFSLHGLCGQAAGSLFLILQSVIALMQPPLQSDGQRTSGIVKCSFFNTLKTFLVSGP